MSLDDYEIIKFLGKGAFGRVSLVKSKIDKQIYALKQVNLVGCPNNEIEATLNEIRLLASLSHPNIIGYKDSFFDNPSKTLNIVMEAAEDGDLNKQLDFAKKSNLFFKENVIWEYLIQLLKGIEFLHNHQIIHRDLKCANIFVTKNGILKIGDMNVSKLTDRNYARTTVGTPYYIAPEVWDNQKYDYKCDLWSLGCIIYELCNKVAPFRGTNFETLRDNIKSGKYNPISQRYSQDLKQIISMMLITNPNKRYSAKELLNTSIIQKRMNYKISNNQNQKFIFIKPIKLPENLKDINDILPHERKQMEENDPYESMKSTIKLMKNKNLNNIKPLNFHNIELSNQQKNNQNNIINNNINNNFNNYQNNNINIPETIRENNITPNLGLKQINNNIIKNNNINQKKHKIPINPKNRKRLIDEKEVFSKIREEFKGIKRNPSANQKKFNDNNKNNKKYNIININMKGKNIKRPQSNSKKREQERASNEQKKNNISSIKKYEMKNHNYNYQGQNFDLKPYKKEIKANYGKLDINQYKENNKSKFNNYLKKGGRNFNIKEIKSQRQIVKQNFKQNDFRKIV